MAAEKQIPVEFYKSEITGLIDLINKADSTTPDQEFAREALEQALDREAGP